VLLINCPERTKRVPAGISLILADDSILSKRSGSKSGNNFLIVGNAVMSNANILEI
jgi:hypothetical protein